jgi:hypothetical protein
MPEPFVYLGAEGTARIGPRGAWKVGDRVTIPTRILGFPHHEQRLGFEGVVRTVDPDGVARVSRVREDE